MTLAIRLLYWPTKLGFPLDLTNPSFLLWNTPTLKILYFQGRESPGAKQRAVKLVLPREDTMTTGPQTLTPAEEGPSPTTAHCPMHSCVVRGHS